MPESTSASPEAHQFCPGYSTPTDGAVLESREGVCFRANLQVLAQRSSWFKDLLSLPPDDGRSVFIPLPSASTDALKYALDCLSRADSDSSLGGDDDDMAEDELEFPLPPRLDYGYLQDLVDLAFAYQLQLVFLPLLREVTDRPFLGYTIQILFATLCDIGLGDADYHRLLVDWVNDLLDLSLDQLDQWCRTTLFVRAPKALTSLERFYRRKEMLEDEIQKADKAAFSRESPTIECENCKTNEWERVSSYGLLLAAGRELVKKDSDNAAGYCAATYSKIVCHACRARIRRHLLWMWTAEMARPEWYDWPILLGLNDKDDLESYVNDDDYDVYGDLDFLDDRRYSFVMTDNEAEGEELSDRGAGGTGARQKL